MLSVISAYYPLKRDDWNPLPLSLTITEIAQITAASRSSVSEILSEWAAEGVAKKDGRRIIVHGSLLADLRR